jgi:flagellar L-ring protein precursor FlgH
MKLFLLIPLLGLLNACTLAEKLSRIGEPPTLSQIHDPTALPGYQPVAMPMPDPVDPPSGHGNSLWQTGSKAFFKDQRANKVGDILTVSIDLDQEQKIEMTPKVNQRSVLSSGVSNLYGMRNRTWGIGPAALAAAAGGAAAGGATNLLNAQSNPNMSGSGSYTVKDKLKINMAATVIQILPNGSMVIEGRQELGLVNEVREIHLTGIIRREDISSSNTITTPKIAQLRIAYRGRGDLTDNMNGPLGHQIINKLSPF